jgi:mannose-6-phosphate isomerase-like protein (cupin superfamily)
MSYPDPRYTGNEGEISARFRHVTQEPELKIGDRATIRYLANGALTHGQFGLYRWEMGPAAPGPIAHFHKTMSESFFILTGSVQLFNGERWLDSGPGDFLYVPEGGIHGFRNISGEPSSMLILFAPGAPREGYFEAIAEMAAGRQFSDEEWAEICIRHDNYFIDPKSQALYRKLILGKSEQGH